MGTLVVTLSGEQQQIKKDCTSRMAMCTLNTSSSTSFSFEEDLRETSSLSDELYGAFDTDRERFQREFYNPGHIAAVGNYYPRYQVTGTAESASAHISYLTRPYFSYKVPSCYGYSKFITVRKM